jgi:cytochrome b561
MTAGLAEEAASQVPTSDVSYDQRTIRLHWVTAAMVGLLWGIAQVIDFFPKGAPKIAVRSVHIVLGVVLGVVLLMRIVWRMRSGRRLPQANRGVVGQLAKIVHWVLYAGLAAVVLLGAANAWARGDSIFSLFRIPKLYASIPQLKPGIESLHATLANALVMLAVAHATAALVHQFVLRDGVLRRMLPGSRSR